MAFQAEGLTNRLYESLTLIALLSVMTDSGTYTCTAIAGLYLVRKTE